MNTKLVVVALVLLSCAILVSTVDACSEKRQDYLRHRENNRHVRSIDINADGKINMCDVVKVTGHFGNHKGECAYSKKADINKDHCISIRDVVFVTAKYGSINP